MSVETQEHEHAGEEKRHVQRVAVLLHTNTVEAAAASAVDDEQTREMMGRARALDVCWVCLQPTSMVLIM